MADKRTNYVVRGFYALLLLAATQGIALAQSEQQKLINDADATFSKMVRDPDMTWIHNNLGQAKGVLIAPAILKAGFIFGGSGGRAVLLARDPNTGHWAGPAFYGLATVSAGFQAGVEVSEAVTLVMTDKGMSALLTPSFKLGGDASVAAGPVGAGAKSNIVADFVTFSRSKGVYGGLNLDGTVVNTSDDWNQAYYGKPVQSPDILIRRSVHAKGAAKLLADVSHAARK